MGGELFVLWDCLLYSTRKDVKKEECTIVNHFHGVSSLQKSTEMCLGRQIAVSGNSGRLTNGTWTTKTQIHDINVQCVGILFYTSGLEVVLPLNQWSSRTEPGGSNDDKKNFMKHPLPFLE